MGSWTAEELRREFPIFSQTGKKQVYLDSAATAQKPLYVLEAVKDFNERAYGSIHRGAYDLSIQATAAYEQAREKIRRWVGARSSSEIIFTKNTTEAINLLAHSYGMTVVGPGDEILISITEHHSNILPWQMVARAKKAVLKYLYVDERGQIPWEEIRTKITDRTKLVSIAQVSNVLGVIHPIQEIAAYAHQKGAAVIVDGAQSVPHLGMDVRAADIDFLVFSGHKMMAPTGIGVLYGKQHLLEQMPPFLTGGDMIEYVEEQSATFAPIPARFEAGTQNVEGAVGLRAAVEYIERLGIKDIRDHEKELTAHAIESLRRLPFIRIFGPGDVENRSSVISFTIEGVHPHDAASILDTYGIAIRSGHHCAQPLMRYMDTHSTCRISFYVYNTKAEIDTLAESLYEVRRWFGYGS